MSRDFAAESLTHGVGVYSSDQFRAGELLLKIDDTWVVTDAEPLDPTEDEFDHHCDYLAGGKVVLIQVPERQPYILRGVHRAFGTDVQNRDSLCSGRPAWVGERPEAARIVVSYAR